MSSPSKKSFVALAEKKTTLTLSKLPLHGQKPARGFRSSVRAVQVLKGAQSAYRKRVYEGSQKRRLHHSPYCNTDSSTALYPKVILGNTSRLTQQTHLQDCQRYPQLIRCKARRRFKVSSLPCFQRRLVLSLLHPHSARQGTEFSVALFPYNSYRILIHVVLIVHSHLYCPRFSENLLMWNRRYSHASSVVSECTAILTQKACTVP